MRVARTDTVARATSFVAVQEVSVAASFAGAPRKVLATSSCFLDRVRKEEKPKSWWKSWPRKASMLKLRRAM